MSVITNKPSFEPFMCSDFCWNGWSEWTYLQGYLRVYLWWLSTLCLLVSQVRVTIGDFFVVVFVWCLLSERVVSNVACTLSVGAVPATPFLLSVSLFLWTFLYSWHWKVSLIPFTILLVVTVPWTEVRPLISTHKGISAWKMSHKHNYKDPSCLL